MKRKTRASKGFDCVEFKRRAQERIYEEIRDLAPESEIEYFHRAVEAGPLGPWWRRVTRRSGRRVG